MSLNVESTGRGVFTSHMWITRFILGFFCTFIWAMFKFAISHLNISLSLLIYSLDLWGLIARVYIARFMFLWSSYRTQVFIYFYSICLFLLGGAKVYLWFRAIRWSISVRHYLDLTQRNQSKWWFARKLHRKLPCILHLKECDTMSHFAYEFYLDLESHGRFTRIQRDAYLSRCYSPVTVVNMSNIFWGRGEWITAWVTQNVTYSFIRFNFHEKKNIYTSFMFVSAFFQCYFLCVMLRQL